MINIGLAGSGYIAETHAKSVLSIPKTKLIGVAGGTRALEFSNRYDIQQYDAVEDMILDKKIDAVILCTPHGLHKEEALLAINNKKHVLIEKPLGTTIRDCEDILTASEKNNVVVMVAHSQRYFPTNKAVYDLLRNNQLGKPLMIRASQIGAGLDISKLDEGHWALDKHLGGYGTTLGYGIHNIDRVLWWTQDLPEYVFGTFRSDWCKQTQEHSSFINFRTRTGIDISTMFQGSFSGKIFDYQKDCAEIICEKGHIECQTYRRVRTSSGDDDWRTIIELDFRKERSNIYRELMNDFISSIRNNTTASITVEDGLNAVKVIELARDSYLTRGLCSWQN